MASMTARLSCAFSFLPSDALDDGDKALLTNSFRSASLQPVKPGIIRTGSLPMILVYTYTLTVSQGPLILSPAQFP